MRIFVTGSADGLGLLAAKRLIADGHRVVLHARNTRRAEEALARAPGAETALAADLAQADQVIDLAQRVNTLTTATNPFDAIIHNAGVYQAPGPLIFAVNSLAPYLLTALIRKPPRLIYLSSGLHTGGKAKLDDLARDTISNITYSDTKFHMVMLAKTVARVLPTVRANAVDPGWVPTKMGGKNAPDDLDEGAATQVWLAVSNDPDAQVTGRYFHHRRQARSAPAADDTALQDAWIARMEAFSDVPFSRD